MSANLQTFNPILKENYVGKSVASQVPTKKSKKAKTKNPKKKMAKIGAMLHSRFKTFAQKVAYVKKKMPSVSDPEGFVAAAISAAGKE